MLRFCFGASGAGKSTTVYQEIIDRSFTEKDKDFLVIVPDQFTMQTQKDVVRMHPSHTIMNIDVLSFGRLSHRIFEEVGLSSFSVLDDVGKSLILRRVADILGDKLPVIGPNMHKPGYIDEVKSTISEFMQYGITDDQLALLEEKSGKRGAHHSKLGDLRLIYSEFHKYISDKYITTEETLDILCKSISKSKLISNSVIIFDGFTGFTPIQYRVIKQLLKSATEVIVTVTIDAGEDVYANSYEEQELFMLSKKTIRDLEKLEYELSQEEMKSVGTLPDFATWRNMRDRSGDIRINSSPVRRLQDNKALSFLEENLFRYNAKKYEGVPQELEIFEASTPEAEVRQTMLKITEAVRSGKYAYRDIAIVCGSLDEYSELIAQTAGRFGIPVYIDQNTSLLLNPFIEYLTSAIGIAISGYKYEDVFHYMRSGMTAFSREDTDLLDNYVRALGIRSKSQWDDRFARRMPRKFMSGNKKADNMTERELSIMEKLENMRVTITDELSPLFRVQKATAKEISDAILEVIDRNNSKARLDEYRDFFIQKGNLRKAKEFEQIYDKVIALLTQIGELIGTDVLTLQEYREILSVGFGDIEVGTIPQDVDRIIVGDMERTRLKEIKILFFLGTVDGAIPSNAGTGGIISDVDRQFLVDLGTGVELAPTPRQQMYIQRLYLYMNLTKPTDKLYLSYAELDGEGKSRRPAYLVPKLRQMFPDLTVERPEDGSFDSQNAAYMDSLMNAAELIRKYAIDVISDEEKSSLYALLKVLGENENTKSTLEKIEAAAFRHYENKPLAKMLALSLYGASLENSVSRLETFASCCYAHFIKYGLQLEERQEYDFDTSDLGNVFHEVLEKYTSEIMTRKIDWRELSDEESEQILGRVLTECVDRYGDTILRSTSRNQHMIDRIHRILTRTVGILKYQVSKGVFNPAFLEMDFREAGNLDEINITLSEDEKTRIIEKMRLRGRIDRVDLCEDDDHIYVKVMDFKSGKKKFNLAFLYHGLQLQLVMYMNVAAAVEKKISGGKEVVPAALLYYHVDDPMADGKGDMQPEDINEAIKKELRTTGLVSDNDEVIQRLDEGLSGKSDVIPVEYNKNGGFSAYSQVISSDDYSAVSGYVNKKIREFGTRILNGDIKVDPYEGGGRNSCTYCQYKTICGYDEKIPGYATRQLDMDEDKAMEAIRLSSQAND